MKWKHEIPNKYDFMRVNTFNFIENEKLNTELEHERNVGQINNDFYQNSQRKEESPITTSSHGDVSSSPNQCQEVAHETHISRTFHEIPESSLGSTSKRYTKCCFKRTPIAVWYTESLSFNIGSTKRNYKEKVFYKNKMHPFHWTETMTTEVNTAPKKFISEITIPLHSDVHFISLEPQQFVAPAAN